MNDLTNFIYPNIQLPQPDQYFLDRTVLFSRNDEVDEINAAILEKFPGEKHVLMSADSIDLENADDNNYPPYPIEYLNSLNVSGLPLAKVLHCKIISGDARFANKEVMIPRIQLSPSAETLPIPLKRRQFPVRLALAMTINKSQGQLVKYVGINLQTSGFHMVNYMLHFHIVLHIIASEFSYHNSIIIRL
ncbi:hypothetical protein AN958_02285 [Leucoagaricus sp. SymC.cos]|nr:hypothetical protein AN958_02285 [Leucoagaricus sp. SymC.cos]